MFTNAVCSDVHTYVLVGVLLMCCPRHTYCPRWSVPQSITPNTDFYTTFFYEKWPGEDTNKIDTTLVY